MQLNIGGHLVSNPIQLVAMLLDQGRFSAPLDEAPADGEEVVVGILSDEEKALYTAMEMISVARDALGVEMWASDDSPSPEMVLQIETLNKWHESLDVQFWSSLDLKYYERRAELGDSFENTGIRAGWLVVVFGAETFVDIMSELR